MLFSFLYRRIIFSISILILIIFMSSDMKAQISNESNWTRVLTDARPTANGTYKDENPEIECVGNTIHFLWTTIKTDFTRGILYYRNSTDGGKTLNPAVIIKDTSGGINEFTGLTATRLKKMVVSGTNIHIAFAYKNEIYYSRSTNNGASFSKPKIIFSLGGTANYSFTDPYISCNGNTVSIGFTEGWGEPFLGAHWYDAISVITSADNGVTFKSTRIRRFANWTWSNLVDVIQSTNKIHALFSSTTGEITNLGVASSSDRGSTYKVNWITDTLNTKANSLLCGYENSYEPKIASTGNNIYIVWGAKDKDGVAKLYFSKSTNDGASFEPPVALINSGDPKRGNIYRASITIAAKGDYVYISYSREDAEYHKAYLIKSSDRGTTFSPQVDLISDGFVFHTYQSYSVNPTIEFNPSDQIGKDVYVAMNRPKIRHSTDGFTTMEPLKIYDLVFDGEFRQRNKLAVDAGGNLHFVYEYEKGKGSEDRRIYYRMIAPTAFAPSATNMSLVLESSDASARWDNMQIPSTPELSFSSAMTIELWVKPKVGSGKQKSIVFKENYTSDGRNLRDGLGLCTEDSDGRQPYAMITTTKQEYAYYNYSPTRIPEGSWSHLAMTYDANGGANNFKLYLNGKLVQSSTVTGNINPYQFEGPIWVGGNIKSQPYRGEVDELRFWNRAVTANEIEANMNKQLTGNENGLIAYYNFNGTTKDITGKGNDGILMYKEEFVPANPVEIKNESGLPFNFYLDQNYPNPFNPETVISYNISAFSYVTLKVYDILGREVAILVNEFKQPGNYNSQFSIINYQLPSGVYFYTLRAGDSSASSGQSFVQTKKMILLK